MDPTPDRAGGAHPDLDRLADLEEGLGPAEGDDDVRHVAGCGRCQGELGRLRAAREALAALPAPTMPVDVADRVHAALADAARRPREATAAGPTEPAGAPAAGGGAPAATVLAAPQDRRGSRWGARLPALAAAASLAAVCGAIGWAVTAGGPSTSNDASTATEGGVSGGSRAESAATDPVVNHTGTRYTIQSLRAAVPSLLADSGDSKALSGDEAGRGPDAATPGRRERAVPQLRALDAPAARDACVRHLGADPAELLATDHAYFGGRPAIVLVFPVPDEPRRVQLFLAGPDCASNPNPIPQIVIANR